MHPKQMIVNRHTDRVPRDTKRKARKGNRSRSSVESGEEEVSEGKGGNQVT